MQKQIKNNGKTVASRYAPVAAGVCQTWKLALKTSTSEEIADAHAQAPKALV
jgi:hypothetical protein